MTLGWVFKCREVQGWQKEIKEYARSCGITEISIEHKSGKITTI